MKNTILRGKVKVLDFDCGIIAIFTCKNSLKNGVEIYSTFASGGFYEKYKEKQVLDRFVTLSTRSGGSRLYFAAFHTFSVILRRYEASERLRSGRNNVHFAASLGNARNSADDAISKTLRFS